MEANRTPEEQAHEFVQALLKPDRIALRRIMEVYRTLPIENVEALMVANLDVIGEMWQKGEVSLSQVYMSGKACEELVDTILPKEDPRRVSQPRMAIAVLEDHHFLGKRMVYSILRASGYELADYGSGSVEAIAGRAQKEGVEILMISVLMLRSALRIKELTTRLKSGSKPVRVLVGGAPFRFDPHLWEEVGADAMGYNASDAVAIISKWTEELA